MFSVVITKLEDALITTVFFLSFFWRFSRYEMQDYKAHTVIREISSNRLVSQSFLFSDVHNGYFLHYDISIYSDLTTRQHRLVLNSSDGVNLMTVYLE